MITRFFGELNGYAALKDGLNGAVNDAYELMKWMKQLKMNRLILLEGSQFYASVMIWNINYFIYKGHIKTTLMLIRSEAHKTYQLLFFLSMFSSFSFLLVWGSCMVNSHWIGIINLKFSSLSIIIYRFVLIIWRNFSWLKNLCYFGTDKMCPTTRFWAWFVIKHSLLLNSLLWVLGLLPCIGRFLPSPLKSFVFTAKALCCASCGNGGSDGYILSCERIDIWVEEGTLS